MPNDDDKVKLLLTQQQADILEYVLQRAQEDPEFFGAVAGSDHRVATRFKMHMGSILSKLKAAMPALRG